MNTIKAFFHIIRAIFQFSKKGKGESRKKTHAGKEGFIFEGLEAAI